MINCVLTYYLSVDTWVCHAIRVTPCFFVQEEDILTDDTAGYTGGTGLIKAQKENIIEKSLDKLKETSTVCIL